MDAVKFIQERNRMCATYTPKRCEGCPADNYGGEGVACIMIDKIDAEKLIPIVEAWTTAHPLINRQMSFLSHYPNADIDDDGVLKVCPKIVEGKNYVKPETCGLVPCSVCRKAYWSVIER